MIEVGNELKPRVILNQASEEHDDLALEVVRAVSSKSRLNSSAKHLN
jgi:hypothetical protein